MDQAEQALELLELGLRPFPVDANKKALVKWGRLQKTPPTEEELAEWWGYWPDAEVAIVTGHPDGLCVLDIDLLPDGDKPKVLPNRWPNDPDKPFPTGCVLQTPSGGKQYFFTTPEDVTVPSKAGELAPGVDTRGQGGYTVVCGHGREIVYGSLSDALETPCPNWLLEEIKYASTKKKKTPVGEYPGTDPKKVLAGVEAGSRDETLFKYASRLRRQGLGKEEAEILVLRAAEHCQPQFPEIEALEKVKSAWERYPAGPSETSEYQETGKKKNSKSKKKNGKDEDEKVIYRTFDYLPEIGSIMAVCNGKGNPAFLRPDGSLVESFPYGDYIIKPPYGAEAQKGLIHYLEDMGDYEDPKDLLEQLKSFYYKYYEGGKAEDYDLMALFALTAWFTPVLPSIPILAFESSASKGKTRGAEVTWLTCPYPYRSSGTKFASWVRTLDRYYHSSLFINEADLPKSDESEELVKFYNVRPLRSEAVIQRMSEGGTYVNSYNVFGPTIITLRQPVFDDAVERRMIKLHPQALRRKDIPYNLPKVAYEEAKELRQKLARLAYERMPEYEHNNYTPADFEGHTIESRLLQLSEGTINISCLLDLYDHTISLLEDLTRQQREAFSFSMDALIMRGYCACILQDGGVIRSGTPSGKIAEAIEHVLGVRIRSSTVGRRAPSIGFVRVGKNLFMKEQMLTQRINEYLPIDEAEEMEAILGDIPLMTTSTSSYLYTPATVDEVDDSEPFDESEIPF